MNRRCCQWLLQVWSFRVWEISSPAFRLRSHCQAAEAARRQTDQSGMSPSIAARGGSTVGFRLTISGGAMASSRMARFFLRYPSGRETKATIRMTPAVSAHWVQRGTMAATLAEIGAGTRPAFFATWYHLLDDGSGLVADGPHPDSGPMVVTGGMGAFSGASGELSAEIIGTNISGCPNLRLTVNLKTRTLASRRCSAELPQQPRSRHAPVASHRVGRHVEDVGRLFDRQPGKELELHHLHFPCVERGEALQGLVECDDIQWRRTAARHPGVERHIDGS